MAASGESGTSGGRGSTEKALTTLYSEVKQIKKRDSVLTSKNQIKRLTRPDPEVTDKEIKKRCWQLSILVHPDKNQDDAGRATVDKVDKLLLDQAQKKKALNVIQAGKEYVEHTDYPELFKQAVYKQTMKLSAELEIERKEKAKEMHKRKQQRKEEIEAEEKWQKNFEESRDVHVDSWQNFQANTKGKKEKKNQTILRPPKVKMEQPY
uniref:J domain-containing protein n=1 Tax=Microcebus murinus TaxID=30608 RepID=A0A8C5W9E1_MICMU